MNERLGGAGAKQPLRWVGAVTGDGLLLLSALLPWMRRGPGSSLRGHDLADALLSLHRSLPGVRTWWLAAAWYAVPMCGALGLIAAALQGPASRAALVIGAVALVTTAAFAAAATAATDLGSIGPGAYVALAGGGLVLGSCLKP